MPVSLFIWRGGRERERERERETKSACHRLASLAQSSVVTFLLFPPWLFCTLVIAVLYEKSHITFKIGGVCVCGGGGVQVNKDMNSAIRCKEPWIIYGDKIFADMCWGQIRSFRFARLLTEWSPFLSISGWCVITSGRGLWERNW